MDAGLGTPLADPGVAVLFLLGVLGGAHCLGMCGPLVSVYADRLGDDRGVTFHELRQHGLFNAGRTIGYAAVGALLGAVGSAVFGVATLAPAGDWLRAGVGLLVGTVIVAVGVGYLLRGAGGGHVSVPLVGGVAGRLVGALTARIDGWVEGPRIAALGTVHALLPCPILYPAYLYAFSTGSAVEGGIALGALGLGTFPTLFAYGAALGSLGAATRARLHRALGAAFVLLGSVPLAKALGLLGYDVPHVPLPMP
ncbi:sulfite exporter TauE/SafE family protein [Halorarius halobius]|uniref:sulfite exporter TauE/SafE family protein n=1 Tax=Halorarius halobius TaxID=2962671 RepID=UPI0020CC6525|nr:sulfite exporter TauE/SafE family protein [Halorarius halobius]